MGLRMKNFNIMEFTEKSDFEGVTKKQRGIYRGGLPKMGAWKFAGLRGSLAKKREVFF